MHGKSMVKTSRTFITWTTCRLHPSPTLSVPAPPKDMCFPDPGVNAEGIPLEDLAGGVGAAAACSASLRLSSCTHAG